MLNFEFLPPINREPFSLGLLPWPLAQDSNTSEAKTKDDRDRYDDTSRRSISVVPDRVPDDYGDTQLPWKNFSRNENAESVAMQLLRENWYLLKQLRLENWVHHAMGIPSTAIAIFHSYHDRLGFSLYNFLRRVPIEAEKYNSVAKVLYRTDYFLYTTVTHALRCFRDSKRYEALLLDTGFIIHPLKALLCQPDHHVLRRLAALEVRYMRYRIGHAMIQGQEFDISTDFLTLVSGRSAKKIARQLSEEALNEFNRLCKRGISVSNENVRRLGACWDQLCHDVEEIAAVEDMRETLKSLTQELYNFHNFFSLSAVLTGLSLAGSHSAIIGHLSDFIDREENYRLYRVNLHIEPSLPFLYPFMIDFKRGNDLALKPIFSFLLYDGFLRDISE